MNASAAIKDAFDGADAVPIQWAAPDMSILGGGRATPPPIPTELFGTVWPLVVDLADGAGAPVDYVAVSVLAVAASLVGGKRRCRPFDTSVWDEPCVLWVGIAGDPSTNKSPGIDAATSPLRTMESAHAAAHAEILQDHEAKVERAKQERKKWEGQVKEAMTEGHDTPRLPDAAVTPEPPARRRLIVQDATPESVGCILAGNHFGTLLLRDEVAGWLSSFDRYSPGGREFYLEAYGGRPFVIDRKSNPQPLRIPFNGVTVLGGIQPEKLSETLLKGVDDGLVARFIWAWPDPIPFQRPRRVADVDRLAAIYRRLDGLRPQTNAFTGEDEGIRLLLDPEAANLFESWCRDQTAEIAGAASLFKGFVGKARGTALRLALMSEFLVWADDDRAPEPTEISCRSMAAAVTFIEAYGKPTALRVFGDAALPPVERSAAAFARYLLRNKLRTFNARDIRDTCGVPDMKQQGPKEALLSHLSEADWIRPAPSRAGNTPGRARSDYVVNPRVFEATQ